MPGLIVFKRRWSVGSDDLVVPGVILLGMHTVCLLALLLSLNIANYDTNVTSIKLLLYHQIGYVAILCLTITAEIAICIISVKGSILDSEVRSRINAWIYFKTAIILLDIVWLTTGAVWLTKYYHASNMEKSKKIFMAVIISNWMLVFITIITVWCTFDAAGRSWVKMKKFQKSMLESESRLDYKCNNGIHRNWRHRKVIRAYQDSWDHRCRLLFCCIASSERSRNSFTEIARLLSDFFRDLDVVPSDVIAGLVLLRKYQCIEREAIVRQRKNGTCEFWSGVPITDRTPFLDLNDTKCYEFFQTIIHYMHYAQGAYGWPMHMMINRANLLHLLPELKCFPCRESINNGVTIIEDNCCNCNYAALKRNLPMNDVEIVYVTYHVDVGETPFFVAIDYMQKKIVISIRGTLSMKDILTDLNAEGEVLPLNPLKQDWIGHKGMVQAAIYIRNKLDEGHLIEKALNRNTSRGTQNFGLVLVGHSLGAGTAAILSVLMKSDYPSLQCFSYSPPGGLLSMPVVEYSKSFITSVVLGKDVVPRIGLYQMEALRADLINAIQHSIDPKWKTISCSIICCGCGRQPTSILQMSNKDVYINQYREERDTSRCTNIHPNDSSISLTLHQPLYPPGRILHLVRQHMKNDERKYIKSWRSIFRSHEPVYRAIWAETTDFNEVLISPIMLQDHMPDKVLDALQKILKANGLCNSELQSQTKTYLNSSNHELHANCILNVKSNDLISNVVDAQLSRHWYLCCLNTRVTKTPNDAKRYLNDHDSTSTNSSKLKKQKHNFNPFVFTTSKSDIKTSCKVITMQRTCNPPSMITCKNVYGSQINNTNDSNIITIPDIAPNLDGHDRENINFRKFPLSSNYCSFAPLASMETLSDLSSISSKSSQGKNLSHISNIDGSIFDKEFYNTPKFFRRTPKFAEKLSSCAEDIRNLEEYKRQRSITTAIASNDNLHEMVSEYSNATVTFTDKESF